MSIGYPEYKPLLNKFLEEIHTLLGKRVVAVVLYGSVARNSATPHSDIDVMIVYRNDKKEIERKMTGLLLQIRESSEYIALENKGFIPEIYPLFISVKKLKTHPWILLDIVDHGIILLDDDDVLRNELTVIRHRMKELGTKKVTLSDGTWYWDIKPNAKLGEVIEL
jgi:predicted nucleotidyltransferase